MNKVSQISEQYKNLWDNMQQSNTLNYQIIGAIIAASVAILTTGLAQMADGIDLLINGLIFFGIFIVTVPGYRLLQGNRRHIWRLSTYIRVFLESQLEDLKWETNVTLQREWIKAQEKVTDKNSFSSLTSANEWFIIFIINSVAAGAATILFWNKIQTNQGSAIAGVLCVVTVYAYFSITSFQQEKNLRRGGKVEQAFYESWVQVRDRIKTIKDSPIRS